MSSSDDDDDWKYWDGRAVKFSWVPEPPNGAALLPGQWTWRVVEATGRREPHLKCPTCHKVTYLRSEKWRLSRDGVVLTYQGKGFGTHGTGTCKSYGRYILLGWAEHQLGGS